MPPADGAVGLRDLARTLLRLWAAYETGSMRYGIFTAVKE